MTVNKRIWLKNGQQWHCSVAEEAAAGVGDTLPKRKDPRIVPYCTDTFFKEDHFKRK